MSDDSAMGEERLEEIEARCNKATPGPWVRGWESPGCIASKDTNGWVVLRLTNQGGLPNSVDFDFIAHARTDVPDLLAEVLRLRSENDALKQQLQELREPEYPDFAPGPWSECGGFIVDINDAPIFKIVSEEYHHKIAIRNFMDRLQGLKP